MVNRLEVPHHLSGRGVERDDRARVVVEAVPLAAEASQALGIPYLPGVQTVSEVMRAQEFGFDALKLFPAELAGGVKKLRQFAELFPTVRFFPTGGINQKNLRNYLQEPNVFSAGGSWLAPANLIDASDWSAIEKLASNAVRVCQQFADR